MTEGDGSKVYARPTVEQIDELLKRHRALIVHFSGTPKGAGSDYNFLYPDDLKAVIKGLCQGGLSCSTVMPGDEFANLEAANATGCVGVILGLNSGQSILDAHPRDCGTRVENGVRVVPNARDINVDDLEQTIVGRAPDSYNEWVIGDFQVVGIFAASPFNIWIETMPNEPPDLPDYLRSTSAIGYIDRTDPARISADFPGLPIYSFVAGKLNVWSEGGWRLVDTTSAPSQFYEPETQVRGTTIP